MQPGQGLDHNHSFGPAGIFLTAMHWPVFGKGRVSRIETQEFKSEGQAHQECPCFADRQDYLPQSLSGSC
jgi:hypothetical protein